MIVEPTDFGALGDAWRGSAVAPAATAAQIALATKFNTAARAARLAAGGMLVPTGPSGGLAAPTPLTVADPSLPVGDYTIKQSNPSGFVVPAYSKVIPAPSAASKAMAGLGIPTGMPLMTKLLIGLAIAVPVGYLGFKYLGKKSSKVVGP